MSARKEVISFPGARQLNDALKFIFSNGAQDAERVNANVNKALAQGNVAKAIGAGAQGVVTTPVAMAYDVVGRPVEAALPAIGNFLTGLSGADQWMSGSGGKMPAKPAAKPQEPKVNPFRGQKKTDPAGKLAQVLDAILSDPGGVSLNQLSAAAPLFPGPTKPVPALDQVIGEAKATADAMYQMDIAAADSMADREAAKKFGQDATAKYYDRLQALAAKQAPLSALIPNPEEQ